MCLTQYQLVYTKEKETTMSDSILNYVHPKIAPLCFTIFVVLIIFDLSYLLNSGKDGIVAFINIIKTYTAFMFITVLLLEMYLGSYSIISEDLLVLNQAFGQIGVFFVLPSCMFKIFKEICFKPILQSQHNEIIDVVNYI